MRYNVHVGHTAKGGGSGRSHQQSKSKPSPSNSAGDGPTRTSQRSIKRPRTYDEDNEFESPPSASKSGSKKPKSHPKGSKSVGPKPVGSTVPKVSDSVPLIILCVLNDFMISIDELDHGYIPGAHSIVVPTSALGLSSILIFKVPWCLRRTVEVAGPPSAALHYTVCGYTFGTITIVEKFSLSM